MSLRIQRKGRGGKGVMGDKFCCQMERQNKEERKRKREREREGDERKKTSSRLSVQEQQHFFPRSQVKSILKCESNFVGNGRKQKHTHVQQHTREEDGNAPPLYVFNTVATIHKKPTHMSKRTEISKGKLNTQVNSDIFNGRGLIIHTHRLRSFHLFITRR